MYSTSRPGMPPSPMELMANWKLVLLLVTVAYVSTVSGRSSGAPPQACGNLSPDPILHGAPPQTNTLPYEIDTSVFHDANAGQLLYTSATTYQITLQPVSGSTATNFRGFLIQPRLAADETTVVGSFAAPGNGDVYQLSSCMPSEGSVTHTTRLDKQTVTISWTSPPVGTGAITFGFAVVQTRQVYWANQRTAMISERSDPCLNNPCQNGGNCTASTNMLDYVCDCDIEYTGTNCSTAIDHCALLTPTCNNGSCEDGLGTFACECNPGYTGDFCNVEIDECLTAGCQNGTCEDLVNDFQCLCYPGWTGQFCETDINYCASGPCDILGAIQCNDENSTYSCTCAIGFTGDNCSEDIDECDPNPCQNSGNCTNFLLGIFEYATEVPPSRGALDRIIWAIVGFAVGIAVTVILCLILLVCCYLTYLSARKGKRKKYDVQKGSEQVKRSSLKMADNQAYGQVLPLKMEDREAYGQVFEKPGAAGICMGSSEVKHGSSSEVDPTELTSTTTFY